MTTIYQLNKTGDSYFFPELNQGTAVSRYSVVFDQELRLEILHIAGKTTLSGQYQIYGGSTLSLGLVYTDNRQHEYFEEITRKEAGRSWQKILKEIQNEALIWQDNNIPNQVLEIKNSFSSHLEALAKRIEKEHGSYFERKKKEEAEFAAAWRKIQEREENK